MDWFQSWCIVSMTGFRVAYPSKTTIVLYSTLRVKMNSGDTIEALSLCFSHVYWATRVLCSSKANTSLLFKLSH